MAHASRSTAAPPARSPIGSPATPIRTTGTDMTSTPPPTSLPEAHRPSEYGSTSTNTPVLSPSQSTSRRIDTTSTALTVPKATRTTNIGWTRRHGRRSASPTATTREVTGQINGSRTTVSSVAAMTSTATINQSRRNGPGGSATLGSAQYRRLVSRNTEPAYGKRSEGEPAERTIHQLAERSVRNWPLTRCAIGPRSGGWLHADVADRRPTRSTNTRQERP